MHRSMLALVIVTFVFWQSHAFPECGGPGNQDIFGQPDPQTCSGPLDPLLNIIPPQDQKCTFGSFDDIAGVWYQQYTSQATPAAEAFQKDQSCIQATYTSLNGGADMTVTFVATKNGQQISYSGSGSDYAVVNFPGKWTTVFPSSPDLFPVLTYTIDSQSYQTRTQYIVRRTDQWMILSDFGCETLFVFSRDPVPDASYASDMTAALDSLYFTGSVGIHQGSDCNYNIGDVSTSTSSSSSSSSSTSGTTGTTSTGVVESSTTSSTSGTTGSSTSSTGTVVDSSTTSTGVIDASTSTGSTGSTTGASSSSSSTNGGGFSLEDNSPNSSANVHAYVCVALAMLCSIFVMMI